MKCKCGNDEFYAFKEVVYDVIVDSDGYLKETISPCCLGEAKMYGPYSCTECGTKYPFIEN
jgi:hypothetical protein